MSGQNILVVDDEVAIHQLISEILSDEGYQVKTAVSASEAEQHLQSWQPDLVLLDIWMPEMDGISLLKQWSESDQLHFPVVMMSGHGNIETAIEATRLGASDFIEKPISLAKLLQTTEQVLQNHQPCIKGPMESSWPVLEPLGNSDTTRELRNHIDKLATTSNNVLFWGESGSGKFSLAFLLHNKRHQKPESATLIDCLSCENLDKALTTEFNQLRDSHGSGSLIITNIDCLTESAQQQLLAFLKQQPQDNIQFLTTCQYDLKQLAQSAHFLQDLLNHLAQISIYVPSLRERSDDVPEILNFYINHLPDQENTPYRKMSFAAQNHLRNYPWPGNMHELKSLVRQLQLLGGDGDIELNEVIEFIQQSDQLSNQTSNNTRYDLSLREAREEFEKDYLLHHLRKVDGKVGDLAKIVGMERTHLYRKLRALNINPKSLKSS